MTDFGKILSTAQFAAKHNLSGVVPPGVNDDAAAGYEVGSMWYDTAKDDAYTCMDATNGAAVWQKIDNDWSPTAITLSDGVTSGATLALAAGAGYYVNFATNADQEWVCNVGLDRNGINYGGEDLRIELHWMIFGVPGVGDNVLWELDYYFGNDGSNSYTGSGGTVTNNVDVSGRTNQIQYTDQLPVINGAAGSTQLQLTLRRNGAGAGSDTYGGAAEVYGINLIM